MYLVPDASLDDGMLDVVMIGDIAQARLPARALPQGVQGHARAATPGVDARARARDRLPAPTGRSPLYADGDPIADLPATVRVLPGALRVIVP